MVSIHHDPDRDQDQSQLGNGRHICPTNGSGDAGLRRTVEPVGPS